MKVFCHGSYPLVSFRLVRSASGDRQIADRQLVIGVFDLPCHLMNITSMEYNVNGMLAALLQLAYVPVDSCQKGKTIPLSFSFSKRAATNR
jgi:hypothetical protein